MIKSVEVKVGFFVVVGFAVLTIFIFSIGGMHRFHKGYYIKAVFNFGDGIETGVPVRVAGVEVGEVKYVKIVNRDGIDKVETTLWIKSDIGVQKDAEVFINSLGLLGEKYVEIFPGSKTAAMLADNDSIVGVDSVPMRKIMEKGLKMVDSFESLTTNLNELVARTNTLLIKIDKGEGTLGKFLNDASLYNHMDEFILDLKAHPWRLLQKPRGEK